MPIEFRCLSCQHLLRTPDESVGKKARCPNCGGIQDIPATESPPHLPPAGSLSTPTDLASATPASTPNSSFASPTTTPSANPFSDHAAPTPPHTQPHLSPPLSSSQVKSRLLIPAIIMLVMHGLGLALLLFILIAGALTINDRGVDDGDIPTFILLGIMGCFSLFSIPGLIAMLSRRFYWLAISTLVFNLAASMLCMMLPLLPFAIWSIVVLVNPQVKAQFR